MSGDFNTLLTIGYAIITLGVVISVIIIIIRNIKISSIILLITWKEVKT